MELEEGVGAGDDGAAGPCGSGLQGGSGTRSSLIGSSKWVGEKSAAEARGLEKGARRPEPDAALVAARLRPIEVSNRGVAVSPRPLAYSEGPVGTREMIRDRGFLSNSR